MNDKKFTEATDREIWNDLNKIQGPETGGRTLNEMIANILSGNLTWCCDQIRKYSHLTFKDGTRMRMHFCPRCGKKISDPEKL